jgi:mannose-1-phosphate guanylyltransferase
VEGRFAVVNGDVMLDFDFRKALAAHEAARAELTLALYEMSDVSQFGVAVTNADGMVIGFVEKPPLGTEPSTLVNAGAWIFEPQLIDDIPPGPVRVEETLFPSLVGRGRRVLGYRFEGLWADVGTAARYLAVNQAMLALGRDCVAENTTVASGATIESSCVGQGTSIGRGAKVRGSVLWENVTVGEGAVVEDSILADGVVVGAGATLRGTVAGRNAHIGPQTMTPPGTSIEPGARYDAGNER